MKIRKLAKTDEKQPILVLTKEDRIRKGEYSEGHLMVLGWFDKKQLGFYQLVPQTNTYRTIKNGGLIECSNLINYPYDPGTDKIAIGLREIAENLEKIVDSKTGRFTSKKLIKDTGIWYASTLI